MTDYEYEYEEEDDDDTLFLDDDAWNYLQEVMQVREEMAEESAAEAELVQGLSAIQDRIGRDLTSREIGEILGHAAHAGTLDVAQVYQDYELEPDPADDDARVQLFAEYIGDEEAAQAGQPESQV